jgi:hypothetical protein
MGVSMRERDIDRKLFHKAHYEILANQFRRSLEIAYEQNGKSELMADGTIRRHFPITSAVVDLAISVAKRLQLDNSEFDPVIFLNRCSPDVDLYPLGELWEGVNKEELVDG